MLSNATDENELDIEMACAALEATHVKCEVSVARDGQEALDFLCREGAYAGRSGPQLDLVFESRTKFRRG